MEQSKEFFKALCRAVGLNFRQACKIVDGRYKPYLSALDDNYYGGNNAWDAKTNALNAAIRNKGVAEVRTKLEQL